MPSTSPNRIHSHQMESSSETAPVPAVKLRLMCSNGGHILPRPHDKSLCYVGGETHIITMDRHTTLSNLTNRITKTLIRSSSSTTSFSLKYQLPSEDLDSLISVTTDEDLENMIDEYERLNSNLKRIRLFVFPTDPVSVSSIGSDLKNFNQSNDWFLNALNSTNSGFSDTSSVNCLLGLDDEKKEGNYRTAIDVHSIPGSPMMETTSSFGSASSIPSLGNLPLIRVNGDDQLKVVGGGTEEQFAQLSVQKRDCKYQDDGGFFGSPAPVVVPVSPVISENSDPFFFYHERSDQGLQMGYLKQQQQQQFQQEQSTGFDFASPDSVLSDCTITEQLSPVAPVVQVQSFSKENLAADSNDTQKTKIQMQQQQKIPNSAYLLSMPTTQIDTQRPQLHHQQLQYVQPQQYIHHQHPSGVVPITSYYQQYPYQPPMDQQNFVYYMPTRQPPQGYNYPLQQLQQPSHADAQPAAATPNNQAAPKSQFLAGDPQLVRVLSGQQNQPQYIGYSEIHHHPSQPHYIQDR